MSGRRIRRATALLVLLLISACGAQALPALPTTAPAQVSLRYALWDNNQVAPYRACADQFEALHPEIRVTIEQYSWGDYLNLLDVSMLIGDAPDVFVLHRSHYAALARVGGLLDLAPLTAREPLELELITPGLQEAWQRDDAVYGIAKDWDTVALFYNADMLAAAGISTQELASAEWNPHDGGSFLQLLKRLTLDANGRNALDPAFDPALTVQFGFLPPAGSDGFGQVQWSSFAAGNGWRLSSQPWLEDGRYDDSRLIEAVQWYADLALVEHVAPSYDAVAGRGAGNLLLERVGAVTSDGSWMVDFFSERAEFPLGVAPLPVGPQGRMSMFNGGADAIWSGTAHVQEAWQWLRYVSSATCAATVGSYGVVFPAQRAGTATALAAFAARGLDMRAFTAPAEERGGTQQFPLTERSPEIHAVLTPLLAEVMRGALSAEAALQQAQGQLAGGN